MAPSSAPPSLVSLRDPSLRPGQQGDARRSRSERAVAASDDNRFEARTERCDPGRIQGARCRVGGLKLKRPVRQRGDGVRRVREGGERAAGHTGRTFWRSQLHRRPAEEREQGALECGVQKKQM